jgi:hypothetical protein
MDAFSRRDAAIVGSFAAQLFDAIVHGVLGAWREKRRLKMIDEIHRTAVV